MTDVLLSPNLRLLADAMSEKQLSDTIVDAAQKLGWLYHRDPVWRPTGTMPGYPDLTLAKDGRIIFAELKSEKGRTSMYQKLWLAHLDDPLNSVEVVIWTPANWYSGEIEEILR